MLLAYLSLLYSLASVSPKLSYTQDANSFVGTFSGELKSNGCRPGPPYIVSGTAKDEHVNMSATRGALLDMAISAKGLFTGKAYLRKHKRGKKI